MKSEVLSRIKSAIDSGPIAAIQHKDFDIEQARLIAADLEPDEKVSLFAKRAESSGAETHLIDGINGLRTTIKEIVADKSCVAVACGGQLKDRLKMPASELVPASCELIEPEEFNKDKLFKLDVGITGVEFGIAETGSIVLSADQEHSLLTSLVSGIHIALIWPDQIVADLMDWTGSFANKANRELTAGITVISGPSKTADIEVELVIGVHGPGQLHLIIMNER